MEQTYRGIQSINLTLEYQREKMVRLKKLITSHYQVYQI